MIGIESKKRMPVKSVELANECRLRERYGWEKRRKRVVDHVDLFYC